jgi:hypothetical protein
MDEEADASSDRHRGEDHTAVDERPIPTEGLRHRREVAADLPSPRGTRGRRIRGRSYHSDMPHPNPRNDRSGTENFSSEAALSSTMRLRPPGGPEEDQGRGLAIVKSGGGKAAGARLSARACQQRRRPFQGPHPGH